MTDLEFTHTPSQISLAAWYLSSEPLVMSYLDWKYPTEDDQMTGEEEIEDMPFGSAKDRLLEIVKEVAEIIDSARGDVDLKKVKEVDKRLKGCTNPEKIPGSALYVSSMSKGVPADGPGISSGNRKRIDWQRRQDWQNYRPDQKTMICLGMFSCVNPSVRE
jgi:cyclin H